MDTWPKPSEVMAALAEALSADGPTVVDATFVSNEMPTGWPRLRKPFCCNREVTTTGARRAVPERAFPRKLTAVIVRVRL